MQLNYLAIYHLPILLLLTYEIGEFHCKVGTDSPGAWTNEHGP